MLLTLALLLSTLVPTAVAEEEAAPEAASSETSTSAPSAPETESAAGAPADAPSEGSPDAPTEDTSDAPTDVPTEGPSDDGPADAPSEDPSDAPTDAPTEDGPADVPADAPVEDPAEDPTDVPTEGPTEDPTDAPTDAPTEDPPDAPTDVPTDVPTEDPADVPTEDPADAPTEDPAEGPTDAPTDAPSEAPTDAPTDDPSDTPPNAPIEDPAEGPTDVPTEVPAEAPPDVPSEEEVPIEEIPIEEVPVEPEELVMADMPLAAEALPAAGAAESAGVIDVTITNTEDTLIVNPYKIPVEMEGLGEICEESVVGDPILIVNNTPAAVEMTTRITASTTGSWELVDAPARREPTALHKINLYYTLQNVEDEDFGGADWNDTTVSAPIPEGEGEPCKLKMDAGTSYAALRIFGDSSWPEAVDSWDEDHDDEELDGLQLKIAFSFMADVDYNIEFSYFDAGTEFWDPMDPPPRGKLLVNGEEVTGNMVTGLKVGEPAEIEVQTDDLSSKTESYQLTLIGYCPSGALDDAESWIYPYDFYSNSDKVLYQWTHTIEPFEVPDGTTLQYYIYVFRSGV